MDAFPPAIRKKLIGITGGIGTGKSTVCRALVARGDWAHIDSDQIARDVVRPGTGGLEAITQAFGPQVLHPDGTLNRPAMRERISQDPTAKLKLEAILHPLIRAESLRQAEVLAEQHFTWIAYEASLLLEAGRKADFFCVVGVKANDAIRIARIQERDGVSETAARAILAAQMPQATKLALCDYVITNDGDTSALAREVARFCEWLKAR